MNGMGDSNENNSITLLFPLERNILFVYTGFGLRYITLEKRERERVLLFSPPGNKCRETRYYLLNILLHLHRVLKSSTTGRSIAGAYFIITRAARVCDSILNSKNPPRPKITHGDKKIYSRLVHQYF